MSSSELLRINSWAGSWEAAFATANLGDVQALGAPGRPAAADGIFSDFIRARRQYHLQLIALGPDRWNDWAMQMTAADRGLRDSRDAAIWAAIAHVDFSGETFPYELDIATLTFPHALSIAGARFESHFTATAMQVLGAFHAANAQFAREAAIDQCIFHGPFLAHDSRWRGRIEARNTHYRGEARLRGAVFAKDVWFASGVFGKLADFTGARFLSDAGFGKVHFEDVACFDGVAFEDILGMESCRFTDAVSFRRAKFAKRLFLRDAVFAQEPVIDGAEFASAPVLDGAQFPEAIPAPTEQPSIRRIAASG